MSRPKSHRQRAEEAAEAVRNAPFAEEENAIEIARLMLPTELIEAASTALKWLHAIATVEKLPGARYSEARLREALALYAKEAP